MGVKRHAQHGVATASGVRAMPRPKSGGRDPEVSQVAMLGDLVQDVAAEFIHFRPGMSVRFDVDRSLATAGHWRYLYADWIVDVGDVETQAYRVIGYGCLAVEIFEVISGTEEPIGIVVDGDAVEPAGVEHEFLSG